MVQYVDADVATILAGQELSRDAFLALLLPVAAGALSYVCFFALTVLFPSGSLPIGRWRRPVIVVLGVAVGVVLVTAFAPTIDFNPDNAASSLALANPYAILPDLPIWGPPPATRDLIFIVVGLHVEVPPGR